jgi:tetratricopeptide (TPR) repeat protein
MKYLLFLLFSFSALAQSNMEKGISLFEQEQYELAKGFFNKELAAAPTNTRVIEYLGDIASHTNRWETAASYYKKLTLLSPKNANYFFKYGGALGMRAQTEGKWVAIRVVGDSKDALDRALLLNPNHIEARWALIEYYLQLPVFVGGSETKAQKYAAELGKISPVDGYLAKAHIDEHYKRYKNAEAQYIKAIEVGGSKLTYERLAQLYKEKFHQPDKALKVLENYKNRNKT